MLEVLKEPEDNTRLRAKLELGKHPAAEVIAATDKWAAALDKNDPEYEHNMLEALWVHQWHNVVDVALLKRELKSPDFRARAAAAHVLCYWRDRVPEAIALFKELANDESPRVRLEAIRAASFFNGADLPAAYDICYATLKHPSDYYLDYVYRETMKQFHMISKDQPVPADPELAALVEKKKNAPPPTTPETKKYGPTRKTLTKAEQKEYDKGHQIFFRDAHCATCHQPNGQGLTPMYPPLTSKEWLSGNDDRLISFVLKGLWGPVDINGKHYDPTKGTPPMTGFEALLKDDEVAAVLTYVRQSFGNDYDPIKPDAVKKVRKAIDAKAGFYMVDELMKEHPIPGWEKWTHIAAHPLILRMIAPSPDKYRCPSTEQRRRSDRSSTERIPPGHVRRDCRAQNISAERALFANCALHSEMRHPLRSRRQDRACYTDRHRRARRPAPVRKPAGFFNGCLKNRKFA